MADIMNWFKAHLPTRRRLIQLYTALLYNAHIKGFITGDIYTGNAKLLCVPGLNCYSCPGAVGACPLGALQNAVASSGSRAPYYVLGILLLFGLILGRTVCGFLCPMGLMQELIHKLPTPKFQKSRFTRGLSALKYAILAVFVVIIPLFYMLQRVPVPAFCKYICPAGTFEGAIGLLANPSNADKLSMLGLLFTRKFVILIVIAAACVFVYRAFCRFLCPLGAIYGLFARFAIIGVKVEPAKCVDCGKCISHCQVDIRRVGDHECIHCGSCIGVCPTKAISFKAGSITLRGPDIPHAPEKKRTLRVKRIAAWCAALALLAGALWYFNHPAPRQAATPSTDKVQTAEDTPIGYEPGMRAPDFSAPVYGSDSAFTLSDHAGKTVIVNFWATWCAPCVQELPYFDEIFQKYGDDVAVVAIHSHLVTDDVEGYLSGFDYSMPFALDETGAIIAAFGGSTMLPQTVVIAPDGTIAYNSTGSITFAELEALILASQAE